MPIDTSDWSEVGGSHVKAIRDQITINVPVHTVWECVADPARHAQWHPFVTGIHGEHRLDGVRECDVSVGGKTAHTRERCITFERGQRISWLVEEDTSGFSRMVVDWSAGFTLEPQASRTLVTAESVFAPRGLLVRLMMPLISRKFHQTQRAILAALKEFAEQQVNL